MSDPLRHELLDIARAVEALKRECGMDPESPTAIRNGRYMSISYRLRALADAAPTEAAPAEAVPIPIAAGRVIAQNYGYDQVVIVARRVGGPEHVTTYGTTKAHCDVISYRLRALADRAPTGAAPADVDAARALLLHAPLAHAGALNNALSMLSAPSPAAQTSGTLRDTGDDDGNESNGCLACVTCGSPVDVCPDDEAATPSSEQAAQTSGALTDEQIIAIRKTIRSDPVAQWGDSLAFARAILAATQTPAAPAAEQAMSDPLRDVRERKAFEQWLGSRDTYANRYAKSLARRRRQP